MKKYLVLAVSGLLSFSAAQAQTESVSNRIGDATGPFETGAFQTLGAVESLLQSMYDFQIGRGFNQFMGFRTPRDMARLMQDPVPREADTFIDIIQTFAEDIDAARATLSLTET